MSMTHCRSAKLAPRSLEMSGSATLTMVTSISNMRVPRQTVVNGVHLRTRTPPSAVGKCCAAGQYMFQLPALRPRQQRTQHHVAQRARGGPVQAAEGADAAGSQGQP